jgi:hypothetical protein
MRWDGTKYLYEMRNAYSNFFRKPERKRRLGDLCVDKSKIIPLLI